LKIAQTSLARKERVKRVPKEQNLFSAEKVNEAVRNQNKLRLNNIQEYFYKGNPGKVFENANKPRKIKNGEVPVLYSAGGMAPSIYFHGQARPIFGQWQYEFVKKTGGTVRGDGSRFGAKADVQYGNVILENPLDNGPSSKYIFSPTDYLRILISHGSVVFNESQNPGFATLAEIVAQYAKGGPNIMYNEKGSVSKDDPFLFEKGTVLFDKFVYNEECLVSSLDEAADLINDDNGKTLKNLIRDANKQHMDYLKSLEEKLSKKDNACIFIGGSENEEIAKTASTFFGTNDYILAKDLIDPEEDPIGYLRQMDMCDLVIILHDYSINKTNNRFLPIAESGYAVMNSKKTLYISKPLDIIEDIEKEYTDAADRTLTYKDVTERGIKDDYKKFTETGRGGRHATMRYLSEFNAGAPFTSSFKLDEFGRAMEDAQWHITHLKHFNKTGR